MAHQGIGDESKRVTGGDGRGRCTGLHLEAAHVGTAHIRHALVSLEALGLADEPPLLRLGLTVDDESRPSVWIVRRKWSLAPYRIRNDCLGRYAQWAWTAVSVDSSREMCSLILTAGENLIAVGEQSKRGWTGMAAEPKR